MVRINHFHESTYFVYFINSKGEEVFSICPNMDSRDSARELFLEKFDNEILKILSFEEYYHTVMSDELYRTLFG